MVKLSSTETYYTHNAKDAYHLTSGTAMIYIVPWSNEKDPDGKETGSAGKMVLLCELEAGRVFPSFSYRDMDYNNWRFAVRSKSGDIEFEIKTDSCTSVLKEKFLKGAGIETFRQEGYENSLVEYYRAEELKAKVFVQRGEKNEPKVSEKSASVVGIALSDGDVKLANTKTELYRMISYACKKGKISIVSEEKLIAACGENFTVQDIARESHFICREVVLDSDWYKSDCGIIIGKTENRTVACIPKGSKYIRYSGSGEKTVKVNDKIAGLLEPKAYCISRALPQNKLTKKDIFAFCRKSVRASDLVWTIILGLLGTLIGILIPTLNQMVYDDYIPIGEFGVLFEICSLIISFMIGKLMFSLVKKLCEFRLSSRVGYELQNAVYYRIFQMPENFFRKYDSADLAQRLMSFGTVSNKITTIIVSTGFSALMSLIYLAKMGKYSGKMTIISVVAVLILGVLIFAVNSSSLKYEAKIAENDGVAASKIFQFLSGIQKFRMAGAEDRAILEYLTPFAEKQQNSIKKNRITSIPSVLSSVAVNIFNMVLYYVIVKKNIGMTTGSFIAFTSAFGTFSSSILELTTSGLEIYGLKATFERLKAITSVATEDEEGKEVVSEISGEITLKDIVFSYDEGSRNILNGFSTEIKQGEYVAIVGPSGCGKSTLLKLMLGFESPKSGRICYDGHDIETLNKHSLRKKLGVVLQNGKLISGSIYDNVTITADHPPMKEVEEVIDAVGLKDDIAAMPMGMHTVLSESGGTISGGQQQRILIARSIMNHPKVLFFDEATSALDNLTQAKVCQNLDKMNMTRIVIAHRLSTIKNCDRILVVKDGVIVEEGNYDKLMALKGLFYDMASRQIAE